MGLYERTVNLREIGPVVVYGNLSGGEALRESAIKMLEEGQVAPEEILSNEAVIGYIAESTVKPKLDAAAVRRLGLDSRAVLLDAIVKAHPQTRRDEQDLTEDLD